MPTSRIFLSHSGADTDMVGRIAGELRALGVDPLVARERIAAGESFISFMDDELSTSDYFLLLWSQSAASRAWVRMEWEAALHRMVNEARAFLFVGKLDDHPIPPLLAPRLYVTLFPDIRPGLSNLVQIWTDDRSAEKESMRPVAPGLPAPPQNPNGTKIYVTSDLFGITCPWQVDLEQPAGAVVNAIRDAFALPKSFDHQGRIGVRFEYHLALDDKRLQRAGRLGDQGVAANSIVWLECEMMPVAAQSPHEGTLTKTVFRGVGSDSVVDSARKYLIGCINERHLGLA
jgi:hypothetical protein